ncbi:MAG: TraR/DksA C4-type zinc finger protein [Patescibacteria group bacterium]
MTTKKIPQSDLEELRIALTTERDNLEEELAGHGRVLNDAGDWEGASIGFDGEEADPNDVADQIEELVTNVPLVAELEEKHTDIVDALEKMEQGIYGICEEGDEPIPLDRLKANPSARTCIEHALD